MCLFCQSSPHKFSNFLLHFPLFIVLDTFLLCTVLPSKRNQISLLISEHECILNLCSISCQNLSIVLIMPAVFPYSYVNFLRSSFLSFPANRLKSVVTQNDRMSFLQFFDFLVPPPAVEFQSPCLCNFCPFFIALHNVFLSFFLSCVKSVCRPTLFSLCKFNIHLLCIYSLSLSHITCRERSLQIYMPKILFKCHFHVSW